ncbi:MAG: helix-turn-helix transcriptional regulator [Actinomycetia bacterium]|nr:helix-turn-helix transcriptional regulator [Actinomycetes bacterium]
MDSQRLAEVAGALSSETRAATMCALMSGTAHTGRELAASVGVAPSTMSEHLGVLVDSGLVSIEPQGRHRYFRVAGPEIAAAIEQLNVTASLVAPLDLPRLPASLRFARSCYDHLAGVIAVVLADRLQALDAVVLDAEGARLGPGASGVLTTMDIDLEQYRSSSAPTVRSCLDWSQRRPHLAGRLGRAMLDTAFDRQWVVRHETRPRELRLTTAGRAALVGQLGLELP